MATRDYSMTDLDRKIFANELQDFATRRASFRNDVTYVDVANTETHYIGDVNSPFYYMEFLVGCHPSPAGHLYMANQIIDAMNKVNDSFNKNALESAYLTTFENSALSISEILKKEYE